MIELAIGNKASKILMVFQTEATVLEDNITDCERIGETM